MKNIQVELKPSSRKGRLYPRLDVETDLLVIESRVQREWAFGINISSLIIFDIDAEGIMANIELLIPSRRWQEVPLLPNPRPSRAASLAFTLSAIQHKFFELPVQVTTDRFKTFVYIDFGTIQHTVTWVSLSSQCFAQVDGDELKGFFLTFKNEPSG